MHPARCSNACTSEWAPPWPRASNSRRCDAPAAAGLGQGGARAAHSCLSWPVADQAGPPSPVTLSGSNVGQPLQRDLRAERPSRLCCQVATSPHPHPHHTPPPHTHTHTRFRPTPPRATRNTHANTPHHQPTSCAGHCGLLHPDAVQRSLAPRGHAHRCRRFLADPQVAGRGQPIAAACSRLRGCGTRLPGARRGLVNWLHASTALCRGFVSSCLFGLLQLVCAPAGTDRHPSSTARAPCWCPWPRPHLRDRCKQSCLTSPPPAPARGPSPPYTHVHTHAHTHTRTHTPSRAPACRDDCLPIGIDINPALEVHSDFVRDVPSQAGRAGGEQGAHWAAPAAVCWGPASPRQILGHRLGWQ